VSARKTFARFMPPPRLGVDEAERHYSRVHVPLARRLLAQHVAITTYSVIRAARQLDANGGWDANVSAWRFATQRFAPAAATTAFDPRVRERLARDHVNCLYQLRRCEVDEEIVLDRMRGQVSFASYLVELDRLPSASDGDARDRARALVDLLSSAAEQIQGVRQIISNTVLRETLAEPLRDERQILTDSFLPGTDKIAYVEVLADEEWSGTELFAEEKVAEWFAAAPQSFTVAACYRTEQGCGFDKR
jgi:hypothetical protein